jgi:hypothetical protein
MKVSATRRKASSPHELGSDLAALTDLLSNYYHQDVWVDHSTDEEVWEEFLSHRPSGAPDLLLADAENLLGRGSVEIRKFVRMHADALGFRRSGQYVTWVRRLQTWLHLKVSSNKSLERTREG